MTTLALSAAISTALVAGIFFAFSTVVIRALTRLEPREGIAAMQSINVVVLNLWFYVAFFGAGALSIATLVVAFLGAVETGRTAALVGVVLYVFGCIGVTGVRNVPLNERLARVEPEDGAASLWNVYVRDWTRWNHVRTAASLAAAVAFAISLGVD